MPNGVYYHKIIKCHYVNYFVGYVNSYGHVVVYIIDNLEFRIRKPNLKERYKKKIITYIEKIQKRRNLFYGKHCNYWSRVKYCSYV